MPKEIDTDKLATAQTLDLSKPPMRDIPHMDFPQVIYLHPKETFRVVKLKNDRGVVVEEYKEPTTHRAKTVKDKVELDKALKSGWKREPYIPVAIPNEDYAEAQAS